jgi:hypothetical protein
MVVASPLTPHATLPSDLRLLLLHGSTGTWWCCSRQSGTALAWARAGVVGVGHMFKAERDCPCMGKGWGCWCGSHAIGCHGCISCLARRGLTDCLCTTEWDRVSSLQCEIPLGTGMGVSRCQMVTILQSFAVVLSFFHHTERSFYHGWASTSWDCQSHAFPGSRAGVSFMSAPGVSKGSLNNQHNAAYTRGMINQQWGLPHC